MGMDYNEAADYVYQVLNLEVKKLYRYYQNKDLTLDDVGGTMEMLEKLYVYFKNNHISLTNDITQI